MHRIRVCFTFIFALLGAVGVFAAESASQILAGVEKAMFAKPSVEVFFTLSTDGSSTQGSACIQGAMFTFTTPRLMAWYDGTTQWAFQTSSKEVSISEPTVDEIMAMNPFGILAHPETYYNVRRMKDADGCYVVRLQPKAKGTGIDHLDLQCTVKTYQPKRLTLTFDDGRTMTLTVDRIVPGVKKDVSQFRYNSTLIPAKEIIDLR